MLLRFLRFILGFGIVVAACFTFAALFHLADIPMPWLRENALYCELQRELAFPEEVAFTQEEYLRAALGYGMTTLFLYVFRSVLGFVCRSR